MTSAAWARKLLPDSAPLRVLVAASFISSIGYGLYLTGGAVYFVRSVGLSPTEVGLGYSVAGLVCLPLGVPIGYLAIRLQCGIVVTSASNLKTGG